jgi:hypothetical protein
MITDDMHNDVGATLIGLYATEAGRQQANVIALNQTSRRYSVLPGQAK